LLRWSRRPNRQGRRTAIAFTASEAERPHGSCSASP
jgi:hypothetical protein